MPSEATKTAGWAVAACLLVAGCAAVPSGPALMVLPGPTRTLEQFQADDGACRQYAQSAMGAVVPAANDRAAANAAAASIVGAATGAIIGAATGHAGEGAAIGAGTGLLWGAAATQAGYTSYELQRRYDIFYGQCMYSRGHQLPSRAGYRVTTYPPANTPPPVVTRDGVVVPRAASRGNAPAAPPPDATVPGNYPPPNTPAPVGAVAAPRSPVTPAPANRPPASAPSTYPPPSYPPAATPPPGTPPPSS